eukprot:CAMPEP_0182532992 /NCGR_PEP_ID=MMETSP1323-20130603/12793_1 /TAXON_ID=236787 /ORGANISM="Florenciella parvula, Strain RCC1693" /LENGTH=59 /DNA_ID=CAMNT_0024742809 /DNA_START=144 /DNA_END=319 /DNA_ORIENTATION=-
MGYCAAVRGPRWKQMELRRSAQMEVGARERERRGERGREKETEEVEEEGKGGRREKEEG